jgi:signal transduction histidine kinase
MRIETRAANGEGLDVRGEAVSSARVPPEFTAGIIHDLGNLIQIASSAVNIIARSPSIRTDLEPVLAGAKTSLQQAGALVRQTIGMARERAAATEQVSLAACLDEIAALIQIGWTRSVRLEIRVDRALPLLQCDPLALQGAVLNLLYNARDAMPDGGAISVSAEAVAFEARVVVELRVTDSGIGMTPETLIRAFDPFFTTKSDGLGGVGLPMVDSFARNAGGRLFIESTYGVGTTVTLRLPAYLPATSHLASQEQAP